MTNVVLAGQVPAQVGRLTGLGCSIVVIISSLYLCVNPYNEVSDIIESILDYFRFLPRSSYTQGAQAPNHSFLLRVERLF